MKTCCCSFECCSSAVDQAQQEYERYNDNISKFGPRYYETHQVRVETIKQKLLDDYIAATLRHDSQDLNNSECHTERGQPPVPFAGDLWRNNAWSSPMLRTNRDGQHM